METCPRSPKATVTKYSNLLIGSCFSVDSLFSFQRARHLICVNRLSIAALALFAAEVA